jgi:hypothetical protein
VKPDWLRGYANTVLALSAADAAVSFVDELLRATTGATALALPRSILAHLALGALATTLPVMLATPRLPATVFVPLGVVTFWLTLGAAPLPLWIDAGRGLALVGCALQLAAAALAFAIVRARSGGRSWWFTAEGPERPAFTWRHSLAFGAALLALGPLALVGYGGVAIATWTQTITHGFVHFGLAGVSLADRHYQRDGREIRLVGMMHIGDPAAYRALTKTFAQESTVVLAEGVSDREQRLATSLQYGRAAHALGLAPQEHFSSYLTEGEDPDAPAPEWPVVRQADVDASAFSAETLECLRWASRVWESPDVASALQEILRGAQEQGPERLQAFQSEVVGMRNRHLVKEIEGAVGEYDHVVVPWGALHLPEIEQAVLGMGFAETSRELHPLFAWSTVVAALW